MKKMISILLMCTYFIGCEAPEIEGRDVFTSINERDDLLSTCDRLSKYGNLLEIRNMIHTDTDRLKALLRISTDYNKPEFSQLTSRISNNSQRLLRITDSKYTLINKKQNLLWDLSLQSLGLTSEAQKAWKVKNIQIQKAYSWKGEDNDLLEFIRLEYNPSGGYLSFQRPASAAEICQLQEVMMILVSIDFVHKDETKRVYYKLYAKTFGVI